LRSAKEPSRASSGEEARRGEAREGAAREARGGGQSRDQLRARRGRGERRSERRRKERSEGAKEGGESEAASPEASGESMEKSESKERSGEGGLSDLLPGERAKSRERLRERREGGRAKRSGEHGEKSEGEKGGSRLPVKGQEEKEPTESGAQNAGLVGEGIFPTQWPLSLWAAEKERKEGRPATGSPVLAMMTRKIFDWRDMERRAKESLSAQSPP
jgi:hypothetical protein